MPDPITANPLARHGFSLIELVIVVVIIGIIGAVAVPRMSRGSEGAAISALTRDLSIMNKAIDLYAAEHDGTFPRLANISQQLTTQTNHTGDAWSGMAGEVAFGAYLQKIPPLPLGDRKGNTAISNIDGNNVGWLYAQNRGIIRPNLNRKNGTTDEVLVAAVISSTELKRDDLVTP